MQGGGDCGQVIAMGLTTPLQNGVEVVSFALKAIGRPVERKSHRAKLEPREGHWRIWEHMFATLV